MIVTIVTIMILISIVNIITIGILITTVTQSVICLVIIDITIINFLIINGFTDIIAPLSVKPDH